MHEASSRRGTNWRRTTPLIGSWRGGGADSLLTPHETDATAHEPITMSHAQPKPYSAATRRTPVADHAMSRPLADAIEWEELPSLVDSLARRLVRRAPGSSSGANDLAFGHSRAFASPWDNTLPAAFDPAPASQPFHERIAGLVTREVNEPGVFLHFFGDRLEQR